MKKIVTICFLLMMAGNCFGQQITFQKTFGTANDEYATSIIQTVDEGYVITGSTYNSVPGWHDVSLIKIDANGNLLWAKAFGGAYNDYGWSVQQTTDGGYIVAGYTESFGAGNADFYLIKTDASGNLLWSKTFGGINFDQAYSVEQTIDGGYIIAGYTQSFGAGGYDFYLVKTDSNGNLLWSKTFGGTTGDYGYSVTQTMDGGYIMTGTTMSFGMGSDDIWLIKTDGNGNSLWTKTYGGTNSDNGRCVKQTTDAGYILLGSTYGFGAGNLDIYLTKTDSSGNLSWTKTFGGTDEDIGYSIKQTNDTGYVIIGHSKSFTPGHNKIYLIKTDTNGDSIWTKIFGGSVGDYGLSIQQTIDVGYVIAGQTYSFGLGIDDFYLIKTNSLGSSGCNEASTATIVTTPVTQVTSPAFIVTSPPTVITTPATIVGGGGTVTTLCTTVGIVSISNFEFPISISPNPTTNHFIITFPNTINKGVIEIYNVLGKKIFSEHVTNVSQKEIRINNLNAGIYFVKIVADQKKYAKKLLIQ
jgi:hypothetical protein